MAILSLRALTAMLTTVVVFALAPFFFSKSTDVKKCCPEINKIEFYDHNWWYYEFCNFYLADLSIPQEGTWPSVEHFYQAHKFNDSFHDLFETVRGLPTGYDAWNFARKHKDFVRPDWENVMDGFMLTALKAKYSQHKDLADLLKGTGTAFLEERTDDDSYWGDGKFLNGTDKLGLFLMKIRADLLQEPIQ